MLRLRTLLVLAVTTAVVAGSISSALARSDRIKGANPFDSSHETVDLFEAIEQGTLSVKLIPRDSKECRLMITNESQESVNVQLPAALSAVPVVAQILPGAVPGMNQGFDQGFDQGSSNAPQRLGVGNPFGRQSPLQMGPNMQGNPLMNPGNGPFFAPFNIAPEKVAHLKLPSVCLDHGHPDPRPAMQYRLEPIASVTELKELVLLCSRLGSAEVSQRVAQAAAWHLSNGKTWEQLQAMRIRGLGRPDRPFFHAYEVVQAKKLVEELAAEARTKAKLRKPREVVSLSMAE